MKENLFAALEQYTSSPENYLTEAFVFILKNLLDEEKTVALRLINRIIPKCVAMEVDEDISIETQVTDKLGRPDIVIYSNKSFVFIEVKRDSLLRPNQIGPYRRILQAHEGQRTAIVLLTRSMIDFKNSERPDLHLFWDQVHGWFQEEFDQITNPVASFLTRDFIQYLEVSRMAIQRISWEYEKGVLALNDLMLMLEIALRESNILVSRFSASWSAKGYYLDSKQSFCGVYFERPNVIRYERYEDNKTIVVGDFDLGKTPFFCESASGQEKMLKEFVKNPEKYGATE